jgi:hypothetical protein
MYGNKKEGKNSIKVKFVPKLMSKLTPMFSFTNCSFGMSKDKQTTARVVVGE